MPTGIEPWRMWGSDQRIVIPANAGQPGFGKAPQLVRIDYARPETWSFLYFAKVVGVNGNVNIGAGTNALQVQFKTVVGVGRSTVELWMPQFDWTGADINTPTPAQTLLLPARFATEWRYTRDAPAGAIPPPGATDPVYTCDHVVAQTVQVYCDVVCAPQVGSSGSIEVVVGAYYSPRTHVRPEWFRDDERSRFMGQEDVGS